MSAQVCSCCHGDRCCCGRASIKDRDTKIAELQAELAEARAEVERLRAQVGAVIRLLGNNGCDCDCDHDNESHGPDCERCLACRVELALKGDPR